MVEITKAFLDAREFLFKNIPKDAEIVTCIQHLRYVPCRPCMYSEDGPATIPYSSKPEDHIKVGNYQRGIT